MKLGVWYVLFAIAIMVVFFVLAYIYHDPHYVNRGGALLAAFAASLVLYEAFFEEKAKVVLGARPETTNGGGNGAKLADLSPRAGLARRLALRKWRSKEQEFNEVRFGLIFLSGVLAVIGEVFHGFGDILFKYVKPFLETVLVPRSLELIAVIVGFFK
jgi:hypothetical protein